MSTPGGSGMNITLDEMHKKDSKDASELDIKMDGNGLDSYLI